MQVVESSYVSIAEGKGGVNAVCHSLFMRTENEGPLEEVGEDRFVSGL